jgi:hypothetical protein
VPIPESPDLYNHQVLTHRVELTLGLRWVVIQDIFPRVQTEAEKQAKAAAAALFKAQLDAARESWRRTVDRAEGPLRVLLVMHQPILGGYTGGKQDIVCQQCDCDDDNEGAEWPCDSWDLLVQLVPEIPTVTVQDVGGTVVQTYPQAPDPYHVTYSPHGPGVYPDKPSRDCQDEDCIKPRDHAGPCVNIANEAL